MKKIISGFFCILTGCILFGNIALADVSAVVVGTRTNEADISVYVKGAEAAVGDAEVQIGTTKADQVQVQKISELDVPVRTLVMVDNSLSIPEKTRGKIAECLQSIISDRMPNEEVSIAVFGEELNVLVDYSSDYATLKRAADSISYQDQETYLTDVLYDLVSTGYENTDIYSRIIIVSDGIDNKSLGYTKEELYLLLQNTGIPICAIGCAKKNNNEELENMFALSRLTSMEYFLLDDVEDVLDITAVLKQDQDILKVTVVPRADMMDGSRKTIKIVFSDGKTVSMEAAMPQQILEEKPEESSAEPKTAGEEEEEEEAEETEELVETEAWKEEPGFPYLSIILAGSAAALAVLILMIVLMIRKKNHKRVKFESIDESILNRLPVEGNIQRPEEKREVYASDIRNSGDGETVMIWDQTINRHLVLTDIHTPARSFQIPLNKPIVVGRTGGKCDIVLDYEKSVSGQHCEIRERGGKYYVKDLQSSNGTFVNQSRVLAETEILPGSILKFGRIEMRFDIR